MSTSNVLSLQVPSRCDTGCVSENDFLFTSPTHGPIAFDAMCGKLSETISNTNDKFTIMVGTDSHVHNNRDVCFVTVVFVHRVSKGGHFFYRKFKKSHITNLKQRMLYEATQSLTTASLLTAELHKQGCTSINLEVHADVGTRGDTRTIVKEIIGMIEAQGFVSRVKPDAPAATKLADRFTR
jgi:uncharacterized protein